MNRAPRLLSESESFTVGVRGAAMAHPLPFWSWTTKRPAFRPLAAAAPSPALMMAWLPPRRASRPTA